MFPKDIEKYITSRAVTDWRTKGNNQCTFAGAIIIPALAERANLFETLSSLALNPPEVLARFLVLVVVNHREDARIPDKFDNMVILEDLERFSLKGLLQLAWVDAASPGCELPIKNGGVGLARKIGLDLALTRFDYTNNDPILVCLDADTLVRPDYLPAILDHFEQSGNHCAIMNFVHQRGSTAQSNSAIIRYELFLRAYVLGLKTAGSMYGFHTVGSAMACRASAYVKIGGMNSRTAGEDFYFLQHLAKTVGVGQVKGTVICPSARASHRVPFGTGRSIAKILEGDPGAVLFYHTDCFRILGKWLELVFNHLEKNGDFLQREAGEISAELGFYLDSIGFKDVWEKLRRNNKGSGTLLSAFNGWFDGLKTMKLIHHLSTGPLQRCEPDQVMPEFLQWAGLTETDGMVNQLELLRRVQLGEDYSVWKKKISAKSCFIAT